MKKLERLLAMVLTLCMVAGLFPSGLNLSVFATEEDGTKENPFVITTAQEWAAQEINFASPEEMYFELGNDITLTSSQCSIPALMNGHIDGAGYVITMDVQGDALVNKAKEQSEDSYFKVGGLFSTMKDASIKNVTLQYSTSKKLTIPDGVNAAHFGFVVGECQNATFENVAVLNPSVNAEYNNITSQELNLGGIAGISTNSTFRNCYVDQMQANMTIYSVDCNNIGGISGHDSGSHIDQCISKRMKITLDGSYFHNHFFNASSSEPRGNCGAVVGRSNGTDICHCFVHYADVNVKTYHWGYFSSPTEKDFCKINTAYIASGTPNVTECVAVQTSGDKMNKDYTGYNYIVNAGQFTSQKITEMSAIGTQSVSQVGESKVRKTSSSSAALDQMASVMPEAKDVFVYDSQYGLTFVWQYAKHPKVDITTPKDNPQDREIVINSQDSARDAEVTLRYTEKGITASPQTPTITTQKATQGKITALYADGKELGWRSDPQVKPGAQVQMVAKLKGKFLATEEDARVIWSILDSKLEGDGTVSISESGLIDVHAISGTFAVEAKTLDGKSSMKDTFTIVPDKITVTAQTNTADMSLVSGEEPLKIPLSVLVEGLEPKPDVSKLTMSVTRTGTDSNPVQAGTEVTNDGGKWTLSVDPHEPAGTLQINAVTEDGMAETVPVEIKVVYPEIQGLTVTEIEGNGTIIFIPGATAAHLANMKIGELKWADGTPVKDYSIKWTVESTNEKMVKIQGGDTSNAVQISVSPEYTGEVIVKATVTKGQVEAVAVGKLNVDRVVGIQVTEKTVTVSPKVVPTSDNTETFYAKAILNSGSSVSIKAADQSLVRWTLKPDDPDPALAGVAEIIDSNNQQASVRFVHKYANKDAKYTLTAEIGVGDAAVSGESQITVKLTKPNITVTAKGNREIDFTGETPTEQTCEFKASWSLINIVESYNWKVVPADEPTKAYIKQHPEMIPTVKNQSGLDGNASVKVTIPVQENAIVVTHNYNIVASIQAASGSVVLTTKQNAPAAATAQQKAPDTLLQSMPSEAPVTQKVQSTPAPKANIAPQAVQNSTPAPVQSNKAAGMSAAAAIPEITFLGNAVPDQAEALFVPAEDTAKVVALTAGPEAADPTESGYPPILPGDKLFKKYGVLVDKASSESALLVALHPADGTDCYYVTTTVTDKAPDKIEVVGKLWQMMADDTGMPQGTKYTEPISIAADETTYIAVCAKQVSGSNAFNIERSNTIVYKIDSTSGTMTVKLVPDLSQEENSAHGTTSFTKTKVIPHGSGEVTWKLSEIRKAMQGDTWNDERRDRDLAEGESIYVSTKMLGNVLFSKDNTQESEVGAVVPTPQIKIVEDSNTGKQNIVITTLDDTLDLYYTVVQGAQAGKPIPSASKGVLGSAALVLGDTYKYEGPLPLFKEYPEMTISAVAVRKSDITQQSARIATLFFGAENQGVPLTPKLLIGRTRDTAADFKPGTYYSNENMNLYFVHPDINYENAVIHYEISLDGKNPSELSPSVTAETINDGIPISEEFKNSNRVYVRAIYMRQDFPPSAIAEFAIDFRTQYHAPDIYYAVEDENGQMVKGDRILDGAKIRKGADILLEPALADIPEEMRPVEKPAVKVIPDPKTDVPNTALEDIPGQTEMRVDLDNKNYSVPTIHYGFGMDPNVPVDKVYHPDRPIILQKVANIDPQTSKDNPEFYQKTEAQAAVPIHLDQGEALDKVYLRVQIIGEAPNHAASDIFTYVFEIQPNLPEPTVTTTIEEGTENTLKVNTPISLDCASDGLEYEIYYNITNKDIREEDIAKSRAWENEYTEWLMSPDEEYSPHLTEEPQPEERFKYRETYVKLGHPEPSAIQYSVPFPVKRNPQRGFWLRAIAVSKTPTRGNSDQLSVYYRIKELEPAAEVTAVPETTDGTQTPLKRGAEITLSTETINPKIYYTLDGSVPSPDAYLDCRTDEERAACPTQVMDSGGSVKMDPPAGTTKFVVRAVTRENSDPSNLADSPEKRFTYQLAKCGAPTAAPETYSSVDMDVEVAKRAPGETINLLPKESTVEIYYTLDGTIPVVPAEGNAPEGATKLYNSNDGIKMELKDTFFIITVIVHDPSNNYADSDPIVYHYQCPAPVQAVYAMPTSIMPVIKGTQISLNCSTEGAQLFYEVTYDGTEPADPVPYKSQSFDAKNPIVADRPLRIKAIAEKEGMISPIADYDYKIAPQLSKPTASIDSGSIVFNGVKLNLNAPSGADVIYTKDGSDPTDPENKNRLFGSDLVLDGKEGDSMTIRAYCTQSQYTPSEVETFTYSISKAEDVLRVTPPSGSVISQNTVISMSTSVSGAQIYYSLDGRDPLTAGAEGNSVALSGAPGSMITLKAAVGVYNSVTGKTEGSAPAVFTYTLMEQTQSPTASIPNNAIVLDGAEVTLAVQDGSIYYTTDGTDPTTSSKLYTEPIPVDGSMILKAMAQAEGKAPSAIVTYTYARANDVFGVQPSVPGGEIVSGTKIELATSTEGARIYYSTNGLTPSDEVLDELLEYTGPINVTRPVTLKFFAVKDGMHSSPVNTVTYTVYDPPVPEKEPEEQQGLITSTTDRLTSRRTFESETDGPAFSDIILYDRQYSTVISGNDGTMDKHAVLMVKLIPDTEEDNRAVAKEQKNFEILSLYDVTLMQDGVPVQPTGEIEIGLPIPTEYQNGVVMICRMNSDSSVEFIPTRRAGGMAYVKVDHLSEYALTAPARGASDAGSNLLLYAGIGAAALALLLLILLIIKRRKNNDNEPQEEEI